MQEYWEFTQKNVFSELFLFLGRMTQENLNRRTEYLKVENTILRKRIGTCTRPTAVEKRKLLKFAIPLEKDIRNIISIVKYETLGINEYIKHYNSTRPHSSMDNMPREYRPSKTTGQIKYPSRLGGIIRRYYRE